jgi:hypothetical protein
MSLSIEQEGVADACPVPYMLVNVEGTCNVDSFFFTFCYSKAIRREVFKRIESLKTKNESLNILLKDLRAASNLLDSNVHKKTCPVFQTHLQLDLKGELYMNVPFKKGGFFFNLTQQMKLNYFSRLNAEKYDFDASLRAFSEASSWNKIVVVEPFRIKKLWNDAKIFKIDEFFEICKKHDYYPRSCYFAIKENERGHVMALSSCTELVEDYRDTQWLFYDANNRGIYMQGSYESLVKGFFSYDNTNVNFFYHSHQFFNEDTKIVLVRKNDETPTMESEKPLENETLSKLQKNVVGANIIAENTETLEERNVQFLKQKEPCPVPRLLVSADGNPVDPYIFALVYPKTVETKITKRFPEMYGFDVENIMNDIKLTKKTIAGERVEKTSKHDCQIFQHLGFEVLSFETDFKNKEEEIKVFRPFFETFDFYLFDEICKLNGYRPRSCIFVVSDKGSTHVATLSSCDDLHVESDKTQWFFYDGQGKKMYLQGFFYNIVCGFFRNEEFHLTWNGAPLFNKNTYIVVVRDESLSNGAQTSQTRLQ